ncbi:MAG: ATP phosphoribosyltransferase [Rhodothermaceae bacterium]|nr:MAG: ATP phosphoribosyltransferase [Rhodothermaceae bacterium]
MNTVLRLALQKSGRLSDASVQLIEACGIRFSRANNRLRCLTDNFPLELLYLRDDDIPGYVADGVADAGIVGENVVAEKRQPVELLERLGFARCRLAIAVPRSTPYDGLADLEGLHIATSYPNLLSDFLRENGIEASIHEISGSVEIAPSIGLADAICDLVSSGSTLLSNGLKEVETVMHSEAVLIGRPDLPPEKAALLDALRFRIQAVLKAQNFKYILLNAPNGAIDRIVELLPGMKSPTVLPLAESGWSSVHSVVNENDFWEVIENLRAAGAQGILVVPIEKMIV